jgi:hypothetical protein
MAVVLVMLVLLLGISAPADAAVLCVNLSGSVFVRTQCKGNETQLNPAALGLIDGSGTVGLIPRWEGPESLGDSIIFQNDLGNVGIGTSPVAKLSVSIPQATLDSRLNVGAGSYGFVEIHADDDEKGYLSLHRGGVLGWQLGFSGSNLVVAATSGPNDLSLGTKILTVTPGGNVGIGTTSPAVDLDILGVSPHSRATGNTVIRTSNNNRIWQFGIRGDTNDVFSITDETVAQFRMVIDTAGNVGIGTALPAFKLDVAGNIHATGVVSSSDERLKTGVKQLGQVLEKLEKIRGISFEWNEGYQGTSRSTGRRSIGVIAQEVEARFPELVTTWGDEGHRAVDYGRLGAVLIEAAKELKAAKDAQAQQIAELEGRLAALEQAIKLGSAPVQLSSSGLLAEWVPVGCRPRPICLWPATPDTSSRSDSCAEKGFMSPIVLSLFDDDPATLYRD